MARVESGLPSVIFGMQSFGEGLDLPGKLCETVFITKLPFAPPSDPVDEARAIRTEDDHAAVICYDKRLTQTAYGRRMLNGLPPYRVEFRRG